MLLTSSISDVIDRIVWPQFQPRGPKHQPKSAVEPVWAADRVSKVAYRTSSCETRLAASPQSIGEPVVSTGESLESVESGTN